MQKTALLLAKSIFFILCIILLLEGILQIGGAIVKKNSLHGNLSWQTNNLRILAVGDSNTYGLYLDQSLSFPAQLEKIWNINHPDRKIEVVNMGYPGTDSFTARENFPKLLQTFKPDIVLLLIGFNDRWSPDAESTSAPASHPLNTALSWIKKIAVCITCSPITCAKNLIKKNCN